MSIKTTHASLFDIPEILDSICNHLSRNQLAVCLQVSRSWNDLFLPQISRFVKFNNPTSDESQVILRRAALIHSLEIDIFDVACFLKPVVSCTNLRRLYCFDRNYNKRSPTDNSPTMNALILLQKNSQLQILHLEQERFFGDTSQQLTLSALEYISTHPSLIQITIRVASSSADFLSVFMHHLPRTVQDLEFSSMSYNFVDPPSIPRQALLSQLHYPWTSLRRLILQSSNWINWFLRRGHGIDWYGIMCNIYCLLELVVTPLVAKSPLLREFRIGHYKGNTRTLLQTLTDCCPDLEIVAIHGSNYLDIQPPNTNSSETTATSIAYNNDITLKGRLNRLREFRMYIWNDSQFQDDYQHIADWIFRSAATLEVVEFEMNDRNWSPIQYPWSLQRQHIDPDSRVSVHVWTDCSRLKKFRVRMREDWTILCCPLCEGDCDPRSPIYLPKALLEDLVRPSSAWQCTELESLDLLVRDTAPPSLIPSCTNGSTPELDSNLEQESILLAQEKIAQARWKFADEVGQLFWRLKDLPKLTNLKLEWTLSGAVNTMALEDLLIMINGDVVEEEEEEYEHTPVIKVKKLIDKAGSRRKVVTQDDLTWLGLGYVFWTRLDIELYTKELEVHALAEVPFQLPPPHEFDNTEHPLHRRVGHGWRDWYAFTRAKGDFDFAYSEDPLESMAQFDAMSKKFEGKDGSWRRRTKRNKGGCLGG
ncbi:MAG: hypothetical protein J3R72DRAFT_492321 [Linnemannia gamsii]|nr:MAG: hypothetical protein J3R72DRAFT_492321 [Linnemannia gamsii]